MRTTALFDLDGTLTDAKPGITRCLVHALERMGRPAPPPESLTWCVGPPLAVSLPTLLECEDQAEIARAIGFYRERFADVGLFENAVFDGVPEMLATLQAEGTRLFVATSKPRVFAVRILDHFGLSGYFDGVYGSELDGTRDDKGELIGHLLATERVSAQAAIMVGDRRHDVVGAARHGVPCLGVLYGYGSAEELTEAGAAALCATPSEVRREVVNAKEGEGQGKWPSTIG